MARNKKKLWQDRTWALYQDVRRWRTFAGRCHTDLTNASLAVREYEREMNALLDELEDEAAEARAECTELYDALMGSNR